MMGVVVVSEDEVNVEDEEDDLTKGGRYRGMMIMGILPTSLWLFYYVFRVTKLTGPIEEAIQEIFLVTFVAIPTYICIWAFVQPIIVDSKIDLSRSFLLCILFIVINYGLLFTGCTTLGTIFG